MRYYTSQLLYFWSSAICVNNLHVCLALSRERVLTSAAICVLAGSDEVAELKMSIKTSTLACILVSE